jgi:WD40 repeat protein
MTSESSFSPGFPRLTVFVSSPGDVAEERHIAKRTIDRLASEFAPIAKLNSVFWEHEPLLATETFQSQIVRPSETDIVICILWSRLGTRLPEHFTRADGTRYNSGTEFEFEDAIEGRRQRGMPDLLVYRKTAEPVVSLKDVQSARQALEQRELLDAFVQKCFHGSDGTLVAAFHPFENAADFESRLEDHLRKLVEHRLQKLGVTFDNPADVARPTWTAGSPFRGLEVFEFEHQAIFFGRTRAIGEVLDRLKRQAGEGRAFLLVLGTSGCGKSSLIRAGVLPLLVQPGLVEGVGLWRRAVMRPGQRTGDLFDTLVAALVRDEALPELTADGTSAADLAKMLRANPDASPHLVKGALSQAASQLSKADTARVQPEARLVLVLDQLEELFTTDDVPLEQQMAFFRAVRSLAESGRTWVIATLRSDFYQRCAEIPDLVELKAGLGQYDLQPPEPLEIAQLIRRPAFAAGLRFEEELQTGERLDDLLRDAAAANRDSLPLLEFTLEELHRRCAGNLLTLAAYREMGGIEGALAQRADEVFAALPESARAALPHAFRQLVTIGGDDDATPARKQAHLTAFDEGGASRTSPARQLVDAFIAARLLTAKQTDNGQAVVEVTHEALLSRWRPLVEWLQQDRELLRIRSRIGVAVERWDREGRPADFLLAPGKPLEEGLMLRHAGFPLSDAENAFIESSQQASRRRDRRKRAAIGAISVVSILAIIGGVLANVMRSRAVESKTQAIAAADDARKSAQIADEQRRVAQDAQKATATALEREAEQRKIAEQSQQATAAALKQETVARQQTEHELRRAESYSLASQSQALFKTAPQRSLLLAVEAAEVTRRAGELETPAARQALYDALSLCGGESLSIPQVDIPAPLDVPDAPMPPMADAPAPPAPGADAGPPQAPPPPAPAAPPAPPAPGAPIPPEQTVPIEDGPKITVTPIATVMALSSDGRWLAATCGERVVDNPTDDRRLEDFAVLVWDLTNDDPGSTLRVLTGINATPQSLCFSPDDTTLLAAAHVKVYGWKVDDAAALEPSLTLDLPPLEGGAGEQPDFSTVAVNVAFSHDGKLLVAGWNNGAIGFWDWQTEGMKEPAAVRRVPENPDGQRLLIEFSPDDSWVAIASARKPGYSEFEKGIGKAISNVLSTVIPLMGVPEAATGWMEIDCFKLTDRRPATDAVKIPLPNQDLKSLAFSTKGDRLAAADSLQDVRLWSFGDDGPHGDPIMIEHYNDALGASGVEALYFLPGDQWLVTGGSTDTRIWDVAALKAGETNRLATVILPGGDLFHANLDQFWLLSASSNQNSLILDDLIHQLAERSPDISRDSEMQQLSIVSGTMAGRDVMRIDARNPTEEQLQPGVVALPGFESNVKTLAVSRNGNTIAASDASGALRFWDVKLSYPSALPYSGLENWSTDQMCIAISADATQALIGKIKSNTTSMPIERQFLDGDPKPGEPLAIALPDDFAGDNCVWSNDGRWLMGSGRQRILCWDLQANRVPNEPSTFAFSEEQGRQVKAIVSPDSRWVAAHYTDKYVIPEGESEPMSLWDLKGGSFKKGRVSLDKHPGAVRMAAFSSDSRWIVSACSDQQVRLFDLHGKSQTGPVHVVKLDAPATAVAFAADAQRFAASDTNGNVRIWRIDAEGKPPHAIGALEPQRGAIGDLQWSPDGRWLLSDAEDAGMRLWDLSDAEKPQFVTLPLAKDRDVVITAFSPDSRWLVTAGGTATPVVLWDLKSDRVTTSGIRLFRRWMPWTEAVSARFSPDSKYLLTGGMLTGVSIWPLDVEELLGLAETTAGRQLTNDERQQYRIQDPPDPMEPK